MENRVSFHWNSATGTENYAMRGFACSAAFDAANVSLKLKRVVFLLKNEWNEREIWSISLSKWDSQWMNGSYYMGLHGPQTNNCNCSQTAEDRSKWSWINGWSFPSISSPFSRNSFLSVAFVFLSSVARYFARWLRVSLNNSEFPLPVAFLQPRWWVRSVTKTLGKSCFGQKKRVLTTVLCRLSSEKQRDYLVFSSSGSSMKVSVRWCSGSTERSSGTKFCKWKRRKAQKGKYFRQRAGFDAGKENIVNHYYSDADTYLLIDAVSVISSKSRNNRRKHSIGFRNAEGTSMGDVWSISHRIHYGNRMGRPHSIDESNSQGLSFWIEVEKRRNRVSWTIWTLFTISLTTSSTKRTFEGLHFAVKTIRTERSLYTITREDQDSIRLSRVSQRISIEK